MWLLTTLEDNMSQRETVEIEIEEELLYQLMLMAHKQDITLNQLVENILREFIDRNTEK
jgi:predicted HicB family RNase H-like nuclease